MDVVEYRAAAALAGPSLLRLRPRPYRVDQVLQSEQNAVYIVEDVSGTVLYVGSTVGRSAHGRLAEHLGDSIRTRRWHVAWVIPLRADTSPAEVRRIKGRVGRQLRPTQNGALPSV